MELVQLANWTSFLKRYTSLYEQIYLLAKTDYPKAELLYLKRNEISGDPTMKEIVFRLDPYLKGVPKSNNLCNLFYNGVEDAAEKIYNLQDVLLQPRLPLIATGLCPRHGKINPKNVLGQVLFIIKKCVDYRWMDLKIHVLYLRIFVNYIRDRSLESRERLNLFSLFYLEVDRPESSSLNKDLFIELSKFRIGLKLEPDAFKHTVASLIRWCSDYHCIHLNKCILTEVSLSGHLMTRTFLCGLAEMSRGLIKSCFDEEGIFTDQFHRSLFYGAELTKTLFMKNYNSNFWDHPGMCRLGASVLLDNLRNLLRAPASEFEINDYLFGTINQVLHDQLHIVEAASASESEYPYYSIRYVITNHMRSEFNQLRALVSAAEFDRFICLPPLEEEVTFVVDVPPEYLDSLTNEVMMNPVQIQPSGAFVDYSTYIYILLQDKKCPFTRVELPTTGVDVDEDLKNYIECFVALNQQD